MSNLLLTFRHGNGNAVNVREAPGRALKNGEIVHQPDTGQVLICTDHDVDADSDEWAGAYPRPHTFAYLNNIRFAWDAGSNTAIVGPTRLKHFNVPRGLEFGGTTRWLTKVRGGWYRSGLQKVRRFGTMRPTVNRPYVQTQWRQIAREELG